MSDEQAPKAKLKIKTDDFTLDLEGDSEFILSAYISVRDEIVRRLNHKIKPPAPKKPDKFDGKFSGRSPYENPQEDYLWVYSCHDIYNKVYVINRANLESSYLSRLIDIKRVKKIFIERDQSELLSSVLSEGKTLWSELTPVGREKLQKS